MLKFIVVIIIISLLTLCFPYTSPSCNASSYYNILSLSCISCPSNTIVSQLDNTYCNCSNTFYKNPSSIGFNYASSCLPITNFVIFSLFRLMIIRLRFYHCMIRMASLIQSQFLVPAMLILMPIGMDVSRVAIIRR